ncbi:30S ribosomal protein S6 [Candidatus Tisiphia endosymbiont of Nemotelus uliginosus]|uniref:30S ribosomal protein S6 n=1 Tax=Candidatus Tisiphia endosymbiont of Nemotelus uliginosus TaxID=3077926 RepID=UPI0035C8F960
MAFYESVFIIRQDVSLADVDKITDDFSKIIKEKVGEIIKTEYWGLRSLAYKIGNNKKGHYVFLGIKADFAVIKEMARKMKLCENIIRFIHIKVDAISNEPSTILKSKNTENEGIVDVTVSS